MQIQQEILRYNVFDSIVVDIFQFSAHLRCV